MLMIMGLLGLSGSYQGAVICLFVAELAALPVMYSMRPTWAIFGSGIFLTSSAGLFAITMYIAGDVAYLSIGMGLLLMAVYLLRLFRNGLPSLWDVQLRMRVPPKVEEPVVAPPPEPSVDDVESANREEESVMS